ncbi:hypothetical protein Tco_0968039 [Tanacetum coccineum]
MGDENPIRTLGDYSKRSHEGYRNTIELLVGNNVVPLRSDTIRLVQNRWSFYELRFEDQNQHLKDFLKLVDSLDLDDEHRERTRLHLLQFSLRDQVAIGLNIFLQNPSPHGRILLPDSLLNSFHREGPLCKFEADFKQQQSEMTNKIDIVLKAITDQIAGTPPSDTVKNPKLSTYPVLSARSYPTEYPQCSTQTHGSINAITIHTEQQSASYDDGEKEIKEEEDNPENIHVNPLTPADPSAILASSSEVPSVLEFLQRRKLEAKKEVAASEFSHLNHSLSHRPVSVKPDISKPDISKASSAGGKLHILKPSCERNGITPTPKESLSPTSGSKVPNSPLTGESNLLIVKASAD